MNCTHCGKCLSRKSARLIDGVVMCPKCMFTPAKQRKTIAVTAARSDEMLLQLGPQGKGANSSSNSLNTLETTMTPNETSPDQAVEAVARAFALGDRVTKTKGSKWTGRVVGFYSTALTSDGYAVESENEPGSVQIYPRAAIAAIPTPPPADHTDLIARLREGAAMSEVLRLNEQLDDAQRMAFGAWAKVGTEAADALQAKRIPYDVDAQIAVMGLLEQGKVTVDPDGYLVLQAHASPREVETFNEQGLLPCPKCGSGDQPYLYWWQRGQAWIVICGKCKHEAAAREDQEYKAREIWNAEARTALELG